MSMASHLIFKVVAGSAPIIGLLVAAAFVAPADVPFLERQLALTAIALAGMAVAERILFGGGWRRVASALGFKQAVRPTLAIALSCSLPMWLFLPVIGWITKTPMSVSAEWLTMLLGVLLLNGLAEEVIHRAFIFGHLRQRYTFATAASISTAIFGLQHAYLLITIGAAAGAASIVLSVLLAWPLALLFEPGGNSIVPPAILHTSSNAPVMIFVSAGNVDAVLLPHMAVVLVSMYLALGMALRRSRSH
jgi:membrane protease YdiL (CAAX protease family)